MLTYEQFMNTNSLKPFTVEEAKRKLEYYCSYQERCHYEVVEKLRGMNMIPQVIDTIVVHLIENNFLNEERFAQSFARGKHNIKKWGKIRIVNELKFRNISKYNIEKALKEITPEDYLNTFHELAERQWESITEKNPQKKKRKFCDYLLRKGFESHLIFEKLNELEQ
ncbi:RecX-type transcriptional regulator [Flavobacterium saliperosum S13]|uniref:Regulatory protein RecX n=3 Tax=Flavobacterium saliperosum TaxID=329186 RepID=A0A1G4V9R5_9FLAO|nr:RecX-type transcriptional regulator [Flavobacterium saliperosum S13]SCX03399.1 regulatory protein [Flavobacterium saliperosum]